MDIEFDPPITIPGTDGATVTMKHEATYQDELDVMAVMPTGVTSDVFRKLYVPARTMVMIESWTLTNGTGAPLEINEEVLLGLPRRVASFIVEEARKRYDGRDEEQEGPFDSDSQQPSTDETSTTPTP